MEENFIACLIGQLVLLRAPGKFPVHLRPSVVNTSFPEFCKAEVGSKISSLKNYNLPDFILSIVAKDCDSDLAEKGKLDKKLHSMNEKAIDLLYRIFVDGAKDDSGDYALYRFYVYTSSMYYKCKPVIDEKMTGKSGKNYSVPIAVKSNEMYISVAFNKSSNKKATKRDIVKFYNIVNDLKLGPEGAQLTDAIYCSSNGFGNNSLEEFENLKNSREENPETQINFKISKFENGIYSLIKPKIIKNIIARRWELILMKNKSDLRKEMLSAQELQKDLLKKRDSILDTKPLNQEEALLITHKIAQLRDFIKLAENSLKMSD